MWISIPSACCPSAPESVDSISESAWQFQALEQFAWSRGKPRASKSWHRGWKTGGFIQRLFGRMPAPSMAARGVAEFMESLPVIPASHSALQASDKEPATRDTSGPRSSASLAKWDPSSCSWRMSQDTFGWDSTKCSVTLPKSGSMLSGRLYAHLMSAHPIDASEFSYWPTPVAGDSKACGAAGYSTTSGRHPGTTLTDAARVWGGPLDPGATGPGSPNTSTLRLNADFVEWLMGFPGGWTVCEPSATLSSRSKQHSPSANWPQGSNDD